MASLTDVWARPLVFVHGKGGVGRTTVSKALARALGAEGHRVLWVTFEAPDSAPGEIQKTKGGVAELNCVPGRAFEEYAGILIGNATLARVFLRNKVIDYLSKAAPGIREITLLGKVWYERTHYERVVVDLPATGHALAMFNSVLNFAELFRGGPVHRDSLRMRGTFGDAAVCGHLVTAIPEEMPLREALEGVEQLNEYFPSNAPAFVLNRRFPAVPVDAAKKPPAEQPDSWPSPIADGAVDFAVKRRLLEDYNLRLWEDAGILKKARVLPQIPLPRQKRADGAVVDALAAEIKSWGLG